MLIGQLRDELSVSKLAAIAGYTLTLSLPSGKMETLGGGAPGNIAYGQAFVDRPTQDITAAITKDAEAAGASIESVSYLPALDPAPIIRLTAPTPRTFAQANPSLGAIFADSGPFEGYYVELDAADASPVEIGTAAFRSGIGGAWYAPGYGGGDAGAG